MATGGARLVAAGIFLSRLFGLVRQRATAHFLGAGLAADALAAAFRIPNLLQNLFGEGSLSASFIPVYAKLLAEGKRDEAGKVAGAILSLLAAAVAVVVLLGVVFAPVIVSVVARGFTEDARALTVLLVRVIFPGIGLLVLSAWCLGILNAHRRFFLSYVSPVLWNLAIIAALVIGGPRQDALTLVVTVAGASVVGSFLQFVIQVPSVLRLERGLRLGFGGGSADVRAVVRNFGPAVATRGVVQVSAYVDALIASLIGVGALATLNYAQAISMLPVSLFGMSIAASELPTMSSAGGDDAAVASALRARLESGLQRIAYFVIPSAAAFVLIGGVLVGGLYQGGAFGADDTQWVWGALAGAAVGLLAGTMGRLYSSALFALRDTRTPFRFAVVRVTLAGLLGAWLALWLPIRLAVDPRWGVAALTAASGAMAWVEFLLLRRAVRRRVGAVRLSARLQLSLWAAAFGAGIVGVAATQWLSGQGPVLVALVVVPAFAATYAGLARLLGVDRARRA